MDMLLPFAALAALAVLPVLAAVFVRRRIAKVALCLLSAPGMLLASVLSSWVLPGVLGPHGVWLAFALWAGAYAIGILLAFKPLKRKTGMLIGGLAVLLAAVTAAFGGPFVYDRSIAEGPSEEVDLRAYQPFGALSSHGLPPSKLAALSEPSALQLTENLPRLDGATALYPLYAAFTQAVYPPSPYYDPYDVMVPLDAKVDGAVFPRTPDDTALDAADAQSGSPVVCTRTEDAFIRLITGYTDIAFLMDVSEAQRAEAEALGLTLTLTPIGREAFVFIVNERNPAENLNIADIKNIYSGAYTNWAQAGGPNAAIRAYQRPAGSGSQIMLQRILDGSPLMEARGDDMFDFMMGMVRRVAEYRNYRHALGYTFLFYLRNMQGEHAVKALSAEGAPPTDENIRSGAYPFALDFYAVTAKKDGAYLNPARGESIDALLAWTQSAQGQDLVERVGYVRRFS